MLFSWDKLCLFFSSLFKAFSFSSPLGSQWGFFFSQTFGCIWLYANSYDASIALKIHPAAAASSHINNKDRKLYCMCLWHHVSHKRFAVNHEQFILLSISLSITPRLRFNLLLNFVAQNPMVTLCPSSTVFSWFTKIKMMC